MLQRLVRNANFLATLINQKLGVRPSNLCVSKCSDDFGA
jgi:hypothetical protein